MRRILAVATTPAGALICCAAAAAVIGWPWGLVAAAGCLVLPVAVVEVMHRLIMAPVVARPDVREPLRVVSVRLAPEAARTNKTFPGKAGGAITEGKNDA